MDLSKFLFDICIIYNINISLTFLLENAQYMKMCYIM